MRIASIAIPAVACLLGACSNAPDHAAASGGLPGDTANNTPFAEIPADTVLRFTGTEPFWGGVIAGERLTWMTPENTAGEIITVSRFAGRGGLTYSGQLSGQSFDLAITPGACSDGMSDRTYPYHATVQWGAQQLNGCAWQQGEDLGPLP